MTTINAPISHAQTESDLGFSHVFTEQEILEELKDRLDVTSFGLVPLVGDVAGTGSDTLRITHVGNIGWDVSMDALASETDTITPKTITTGYSEVAVALYGLAHSDTFKQQAVGREDAVTVERLKDSVPDSWLATIRSLTASAMAGFGTDVGSKSRDAQIDDWLDIATVFRETLGSRVRGMPWAVLAPQQVTQSLASAAQHPAYQNSVAEFGGIQGLDQSQVLENFLGLRFNVAMTDDVEQSGGGYDGGVFSPGGVGWARASTASVRTGQPETTMLIPEFGIIITEPGDSSRQGKRLYEARTLIGVAAGDSAVHVQRGFISNT